MDRKFVIITVMLCLVSFSMGILFSNENQNEELSNNIENVNSFEVELEDNSIAPIKLTAKEKSFFDVFFSYYDTMYAFKVDNSNVKKVHVKKDFYSNGDLVESKIIKTLSLGEDAEVQKYFCSIYDVTNDGKLNLAFADEGGKTSRIADVDVIKYEKALCPLKREMIKSGEEYPVYVALDKVKQSDVIDISSEKIDPMLKKVALTDKSLVYAENVEIIYLVFE